MYRRDPNVKPDDDFIDLQKAVFNLADSRLAAHVAELGLPADSEIYSLFGFRSKDFIDDPVRWNVLGFLMEPVFERAPL